MSEQQDLFQQAMNLGHSAAWDQLWDRAAAFYRQALQTIPDHPAALADLGLALFQLQEYEQALVPLEKLAGIAPDDPLPVERLALVYERLGSLDQASQSYLRAADLYVNMRDLDKARENWQQVTRISPSNLVAHTRLALVFERTSEEQKAVSELLAVASLLQEAGDMERAAQAVNHALQLVPGSPAANQALVMLKEGQTLPKPVRPRGGTAPLRMAQVQRQVPAEEPDVASVPLDPIARAKQRSLTLLARVLFESPGETDEQGGRPVLQELLNGVGSPAKTVDHARICLHLGQLVDLQTSERYPEAAEELERAIEFGLVLPAAFFDLAYLYHLTGRSEKAIPFLQQSLAQEDFTFAAYLLLSGIHQAAGRFTEAAIASMEALKIADTRAVSAEQSSDLRQLYDPLIESLRSETSQPTLEQIVSQVQAMVNRPDYLVHIINLRQQLPSHRPGNPPLPVAELIFPAQSSQVIDMVTSIHDLSDLNLQRTAMEEAFFALEHAPTYLPLHSYIAELMLKENHVQDAVEKFTVIARAYGARGETQRAIELYRRVIELAPVDLNARSKLIEQLVACGMVDGALSEYMRLAEVYVSLADLVMARKTYTNALRFAQQSRVERSTRVKILHRMADIDMQSLDWRQALRIYEQIRTLQPDDEIARTNLFQLNLRMGQDKAALAELDNFIGYLINNDRLAAAVAFVESQVQEAPRKLALLRRLAELYRITGRTDEAIALFDQIGDVLLEANDNKAAARVIETIISMDPPNKQDYQVLLAQIKPQA